MNAQFLKTQSRYRLYLRHLAKSATSEQLTQLHKQRSSEFNPDATSRDATIALVCRRELRIRANAKPARILVKVTCNTGKNWTTQINGNLQSATAYFMGQLSVDECEFTGKETHHVVMQVVEVTA